MKAFQIISYTTTGCTAMFGSLNSLSAPFLPGESGCVNTQPHGKEVGMLRCSPFQISPIRPIICAIAIAGAA